MTWRIEEYRGLTGLQRLEADWRRLYAEMPNRSRYHAYEAQVAYLKNLTPAPDRSRYLALTDGDSVRAICPLEARDDKSFGVGIACWALPCHPHWSVTDVLCPDDEAHRALLPAVIAFVRARPERRPLLVLGPLLEVSTVWDGLAQANRGKCSLHAELPSNYFDCTNSYDELASRFTKHFRRNLRAHHRKIEALPDVQYTTVTGGEEVAAALETFMSIEASGWKGANGAKSAIALHPQVASFYRDLADGMVAPSDRCEINSLHVDGRCVASQFCVRTGQEYTILKIAYDESFARLGPGQLLLDTTLRRCCEDASIARLDLVSDASWFKDWHTDTIPMRQAHVAASRWLGRPFIPALDFRYGTARRMVRTLRDVRRQKAGRRANRTAPDHAQEGR